MTSTAIPDLSREALAAPSLRRSLAAMVRRRVPANDVEDVAQTILCDALAAPSIPSDPEDLRRFVAGIARHKVADFHRGARRAARDVPTSEPVVGPPPFEARALLTQIAAAVAASGREQETLEWLVREHAGEQLQTIAADAGLPAPAVRQRVSRLRRVLRAQWAHALALLVVAGGCGVLADRAHRTRTAIVADPEGDPVVRAAVVLQGRWRIERFATEEPNAAATSFASVARVEVRIAGRRLELVGAGHTVMRTLSSVSPREPGSLAIEIRDDQGGVQHATATIDGDRVHLTVHDGPLRGTADLIRY